MLFTFNVKAQAVYSAVAAAGNYTWTCPPGVTSIVVKTWGSGGGGGGGATVAQANGGGGGGGAYAQSTLTVVPGTIYFLTVAAGGTAGAAAGGNGGNGNLSYFGNTASGLPAGAAVVAAGGTGGIGTTSTALGTGGAGGLVASSTGTIKFAGGSSITAIASSSSGGGSSAGANIVAGGTTGTGIIGNNGANPTAGAAPLGGFAGGAGSSAAAGAAGVVGVAGGGGGGGGRRGTTATNRAGGAGGVGRIEICYNQLYCSASGTPTYYISNVTTTGGVANISNATVANGGYAYFPAQVVSQYPGSSVNFSTTNTGSSGTAIFVDWNNNGSFADAGDQVAATTGWATSLTGSITVPVGTAAGNKLMRVAHDYNLITPIACPVGVTGETEDYTFTVLAASACTGTPNAGTATITSSTGCASTNFTLNTSGLSTGSGISYQWQTSSSAGGTYTNVGAAGSSLTTSTATTAYYKLNTTCSGSGLVNYTNVVSYAVVACTNVPSSGSNSVACGTNTMLYDNGGSAGDYIASSNGYTVLNNTLGSTGVISISGTYGYVETNYDYIRIYSGVGTGGTLLYTYSNTAGGTITPFSSAAGETITVQFTSDGSGQGAGFALNAVYSGSCSAPSCSGTPTPGNTVTSSASVASGATVNLSLSTPPTGSGLTYQWQSGPSNTGPWTNIGGATSSTYTATVSATTWYQCIVTCSGANGTSTPVQVTAVVANNIPFTGSLSIACGTSTLIYDHAGSTTDYSISANGYIVLNNSIGSTSVISLTGTYTTEANYDYLKIYDGVGTAGTLLYTYSGTGTITPFTSTAGQTITILFTSDGSTNGAGIALNAVYSGSCSVPACSGTPNAGTATITSASGCPSINFTLNSSGLSTGTTGISYLWESSPNNSTWTSTGITTTSYTTSTATTMYYRLKTTCSNSGLVNYTNVVSYTNTAVTPGTPTNLSTSVTGTTTATCSWAAGTPAGSATVSYYIAVYNAAGTQVIAPTSISGTTAYLTGLTCNTTYYYTVYASTNCNNTSSTVATSGNFTTNMCQMMVPSTGNNNYTVCSGNLYDFGGSTGDYINSCDGYTVLYPGTSGNMVSVTGVSSAGESCCDYVSVYNGVGTGGTLLGTYYMGTVPPALTSTDATGALTIKFHSDGSVVGAGFDLSIACVPPPDFRAQFISMSTGSVNWCAGETRTISVVIKNTGALPWTDGSGKDFNIGVKWNTNGTSWSDYNVRVDAQNLAVGATATFTFSLKAADFVTGGAYGANLAAGSNNITFDVVSEGCFWFGTNTSYGCGSCSGNTVYTSGAQTINALPTAVIVTPSTASICPGTIQPLSASGGTFPTSMTLLNEPFAVSLPIGWTTVVGSGDAISMSNTNSAGGTAYEAVITGNSQSTNVTDMLYYGPINTTGLTSLTLTWNNYLNHYLSSYGYSVSVQTSTDHATWHNTSWVTNPVTTSIVQGLQTVTINTSDVGSSTFYLAFNMSGLTFGAFRWNIDNVMITANAASNSNIIWSSTTGLYTDASATAAYTGTVSPSVYATPLTGITYTATSTSLAGCTSSGTSAITINTPTFSGSPINGDYIWNGQTDSHYNTPSNWYIYNNSALSKATLTPTLSTNIFIPATGTCVNNQPKTDITADLANKVVIENNAVLTIQSGQTLTATGNLTINSGGTIDFSSSNGQLHVKGNLTIDGTLNSGTGKVVMEGTSLQTISGASSPSLYDLEINNTSGVNLNQNITLKNTLTLTNGQLNTSLNLTSSTSKLNMLIDATYNANTTIGSATSFVNGPMTYSIANNSQKIIKLPLGAGGTDWRPAELTVTHSTTTPYTYTATLNNASAFDLNWTLPGTLSHVSKVHYLDIERSNSTADLSSASIKMYYSSTAGTDDVVTDYANLSIAKAPIAGNSWTDIDGTATANGTGSIVSGVFNSFSRFAIANKITGSNPLPIELMSFDAHLNGSVVDLNWSTATEINNDYFTIEKTKDAINFETVAKVSGAGNSTAQLNYATVDAHPYNGISYYRLKQTDYNGSFTYSNMVSVEYKNSNSPFSLGIFPNPSNGSVINFSYNLLKGDKVSIIIYDLSGKLIYQKEIVIEDFNEKTYSIIPSEKLAPGVYLVKGIHNDYIDNKRLIVE